MFKNKHLPATLTALAFLFHLLATAPLARAQEPQPQAANTPAPSNLTDEQKLKLAVDKLIDVQKKLNEIKSKRAEEENRLSSEESDHVNDKEWHLKNEAASRQADQIQQKLETACDELQTEVKRLKSLIAVHQEQALQEMKDALLKAAARPHPSPRVPANAQPKP